MKEISRGFFTLVDDIETEIKKISTDSEVTRHIQGVGSQGSVPRPHITIGIPRKMQDVGVVSGKDGPFCIDVGPQDQEAFLIQINNLCRKI